MHTGLVQRNETERKKMREGDGVAGKWMTTSDDGWLYMGLSLKLHKNPFFFYFIKYAFGPLLMKI